MEISKQTLTVKVGPRACREVEPMSEILRNVSSIVVRIVLPIGIASPPVIFLPPPLFLLLLLSLQIEEELVIHILFIILFIVKFESALITDPNFFGISSFVTSTVHPQSRIFFIRSS